MRRREFLRRAAGAAALGGLGPSCGTGPTTGSEVELSGYRSRAVGPNLLFVFADQFRGQALGFLGEEPVVTPKLDGFAEESVVFTNAASNYPLCSPYRAMLMTGMYPHSNGVLGNCYATDGADYEYELRESDRCWSDVLADEGHSLGYIGKWHLDWPRRPFVESYNNGARGAWNEWCPPARRHGFQYWYSYGTFDRHMQPEYWSTEMARDERLKIDQWGPEHETDLAIEYLRNEGGSRREGGKPFALVVSYNPPHTPYAAHPERYDRVYEGMSTEDILAGRPNVMPAGTKWGDHTRRHLRGYYASVTGVDDQFGRLLRCLAEEGLADDTVVVFTADHGDCVGMHGQVTKNNPYECSMRVPLLVRWPGRIAPRREDALISAPDIHPTLLGLMGLGGAVPASVEGTSFAPLLMGREQALPTSQLYVKVPPGSPPLGKRGVRTARYTLVVDRRADGTERTTLHDREEDPHQIRDVAAERPELVKRFFERELVPWLERTRDPWLGPPRHV